MHCHQIYQAEEHITEHIDGWGIKSNHCHSTDLRDALRLKLFANHNRKVLSFWSPKAQVHPPTLRTIHVLNE